MLKVGDKVRVKSLDWWNHLTKGGIYLFSLKNSSRGFNRKMSKYCGKEAILESVDSKEIYIKLDIDKDKWNWTSEMFDIIKDDKTKESKMTVDEQIEIL